VRASAGVSAAAALAVALLLSSPSVRAQDRHPGGDHPGAIPEPDDELPPPPRGPALPPPEWPRPAPPPEDALGRDEAREASGTSWQPLTTPHRAVHLALGPGLLMLHGSAFLAWSDQGGPRGGDEVFAATWLMAMARAPVGPGSLSLRAMASLDPFTMPRDGYPELLQSGESAGGAPLHDRQHPHDLWMELAAIARVPLGDAAALVLYGGPVGEPALGPVAFPHRASALHDPAAPLSHHWMDSTHISDGVLTGALALRDVKLEASWFNGREPDEHRTDLDRPRLDSWSARLSAAPIPELVLQASFGFLKSPEALVPGEDQHRVTASALWDERIGRAGNAALLLAWGRNVEGGRADDAVLLEGTFDRSGRDAIFARAEWVVKSARDLVVPQADQERRFDVLALAMGYAHTFASFYGVAPAIGARVAVHGVPSALSALYGKLGVAGLPPAGVFVFGQLLPAVNDAAHAGHGHGAAGEHGEHGGHGEDPDHDGEHGEHGEHDRGQHER
jgi:hypothetical protein